MVGSEHWDWTESRRKVADVAGLTQRFDAVHEWVVSPDGEQISVPVRDDDELTVVTNGEPWEGRWEKVWQLCYLSDGRAMALVMADDEWTVALNGKTWEESWDFVWNPQISADGSVVAVQIKDGPRYGLAIDGKPLDGQFESMREFALSADGQHTAAAVQMERVPEGDIFKYAEGVWSVAVDGTPWDERFLNVYGPAFDGTGKRVAAQVRLDIADYSVIADRKVWDAKYGSVWEPVFRPDGALLAPVRANGSWTLAQDGDFLWKGRYAQLWRTVLSPDASRVAAVVAPGFGRWTVAVDDVPWALTFESAVLSPIWSPNGKRVAVAFRDADRWGIAIDGKRWAEGFDMVWDPVFSPDSSVAVTKVERDGGFTFDAEGRLWNNWFDALWDPVFSPDGNAVLVRGVVDGAYYRQVVALSELCG